MHLPGVCGRASRRVCLDRRRSTLIERGRMRLPSVAAPLRRPAGLVLRLAARVSRRVGLFLRLAWLFSRLATLFPRPVQLFWRLAALFWRLAALFLRRARLVLRLAALFLRRPGSASGQGLRFERHARRSLLLPRRGEGEPDSSEAYLAVAAFHAGRALTDFHHAAKCL
jgi:hypothetical protein